jgi:hypothetical protein
VGPKISGSEDEEWIPLLQTTMVMVGCQVFADFHTIPPPLPNMELPNAKTSNIQDIIRDTFGFRV